MSESTGPGSPSVHVRTIEHQLTRDEVVPLVYRQFLHRWQNWGLPVAGICLVVSGATVLVLDSADDVAWVVLVASGLVVLSIFLALVPVTPNRIWKRLGKQFAVRTLDISDEGISRHTALNDSMLRWAMFSDVTMRDDLFLLVVGSGPGFFIVPKRAFTSQADEATFRELAERSIAAHTEGHPS
jgi:hypothetical protein